MRTSALLLALVAVALIPVQIVLYGVHIPQSPGEWVVELVGAGAAIAAICLCKWGK